MTKTHEREHSWDDCLRAGTREISKDNFRAKSLIGMAKSRIKYAAEPNNENACFIFEQYYASALEMVQALMLMDGYKSDNHLCCGYYLRDKIRRDDLFLIFDESRMQRNSQIYYGNMTEPKKALLLIKELKRLIKELDEDIKVKLK